MDHPIMEKDQYCYAPPSEDSRENTELKSSVINTPKDQNRLDSSTENPKFDQKITFRDIFQLSVLVLNHIMCQWVSYIVVYSSPGDDSRTSLKVDLNLSDTEYGILSGVTFALLSGTFSLVSGAIVDVFSRKITLIIAGTLWAALTFAQSFATNFVTILIPRMLMETTITA